MAKLTQEELIAKQLEKQNNTMQSLSERQHALLTGLLEEEIKANQINSKSSEEAKQAQKERRKEMYNLTSLPGIAESISKNLGMEKGTKRILEDKMAEMVHYNKDVRDALKHGDSGVVKQEMIDMLTNQLSNLKLDMGSVERKQYQMMLDELKRSGESMFDWDKIGDKADSVFFPLTQKFWKVAEGIRSSAEKIPYFGKLASEGMIEHYRQGLEEIGGIFKTHMSTIMAPMDAIIGPMKAVAKTMFSVGKTLFSGSSNLEEETAKYTRLTYEAVSGNRQDVKESIKTRIKLWVKMQFSLAALLLQQKKEWLWEKAERAKEKAREIYAKAKGGLAEIFKGLMKIGPMIMGLFSAIGTFVSTILLPAIPIIATIVSVGKIVYNLFKDFDKLKEMFMDGDWAGFGRLLAADILDGLLMLPEMIINGALSLMGSDFRVDFGKDAILKAIDDMTEWVFDSITVPVMDFFTITIPNIFDDLGKTMSGWFEAIPSTFSQMFQNLVDNLAYIFSDLNPVTMGKKIWNMIVDRLAGVFDGFMVTKGIASTLRGMKAEIPETEKTTVTGKNISIVPSTTTGATSKAAAIKEQVAIQKATQQELRQTNNTLTENNENQKVLIQNIQTGAKEHPKEIPTDTSDLGIMFNNAVYGA